MNPKGGMNTTELKKLFNKSYLPLYLDISEEPGKNVLAKLDSDQVERILNVLRGADYSVS